jgi:uncharacterized protein
MPPARAPFSPLANPEMLEPHIRQYLESEPGPKIDVAWHGGEPTLMGLDFFRRAIELEHRHRRPGTVVSNVIRTNGTLLDDDWCAFLRDNGFRVELKLDGPQELHDLYRVDNGGLPTFERAMRGLFHLKKHGVPIDVFTTVHSVNADYPLEVYRFLRDEAGARVMKFVPVVERLSSVGHLDGDMVTDRSVGGEQFGRFLIAVFDEWMRRDVGRVFVQAFDAALAAWSDGDLYARDQLDGLPRYCRNCSVRFACKGGLPKDRFVRTPEGEPNLNYLCAGYKAFFEHVDRPIRRIAALLRSGQMLSELTHDPAQRAPTPTHNRLDELTSQ